MPILSTGCGCKISPLSQQFRWWVLGRRQTLLWVSLSWIEFCHASLKLGIRRQYYCNSLLCDSHVLGALERYSRFHSFVFCVHEHEFEHNFFYDFASWTIHSLFASGCHLWVIPHPQVIWNFQILRKWVSLKCETNTGFSTRSAEGLHFMEYMQVFLVVVWSMKVPVSVTGKYWDVLYYWTCN